MRRQELAKLVLPIFSIPAKCVFIIQLFARSYHDHSQRFCHTSLYRMGKKKFRFSRVTDEFWQTRTPLCVK